MQMIFTFGILFWAVGATPAPSIRRANNNVHPKLSWKQTLSAMPESKTYPDAKAGII